VGGHGYKRTTADHCVYRSMCMSECQNAVVQEQLHLELKQLDGRLSFSMVAWRKKLHVSLIGV